MKLMLNFKTNRNIDNTIRFKGRFLFLVNSPYSNVTGYPYHKLTSIYLFLKYFYFLLESVKAPCKDKTSKAIEDAIKVWLKQAPFREKKRSL